MKTSQIIARAGILIVTTTPIVANADIWDQYFACLNKCAENNRTCLDNIEAAEKARDTTYRNCLADSETNYAAALATCPSATAYPTEHNLCVLKAGQAKAAEVEGCETQKDTADLAIETMTTKCVTSDNECRLPCDKIICPDIGNELAANLTLQDPTASAIQSEFCAVFVNSTPLGLE